MQMPIPGRSRAKVAALALVFLASLIVIPVNASSESTTGIDHVIDPDTYRWFALAVQAGETVEIDVDVQSGPDAGFYFVNQAGYDAFVAAWPSIGGFTAYIAELSDVEARSIHRSAPAPAEGLFYLLIVNDDPSTASVVTGSVMSSSEFPAALITTVLLVIAVAAVVVVVVALVITRSLRAKAQQYAPPGQPTPLGQTHQHMTASLKPVLQQSIGRVCPKCGAAVAREAATCPKCGTRL